MFLSHPQAKFGGRWGTNVPPAIILRAVCLGALLGLVASHWARLPWQVGVISLAAIVLWYILFPVRLPLMLGAIGCVLALLRMGSATVTLSPQALLGPANFTAQIIQPPRASDSVTRYLVQPIGLPTKMLLVTKPIPAFGYGDTITVSCPELTVEDFSAYQTQGIERECAFPELSLVQVAKPTFRTRLLALRQRAGVTLQSILNEPYVSLATGMLWGDDAGIPSSLSQAFRRTGTSHLLAVSGYNVMVLTSILFAVLLSLGLWRQHAALVVVGLVVVFVAFTGAEPAVVRAGIMGSLVVVARLLGRRVDSVNMLLITATAMLVFEPKLITNLGFQLSFAAMGGLMFLGPVLIHKLTSLPQVLGFRESVAQTLAAILVTTPIILLRLGQVSTVAPVANLLLAPVVVLVFALGLPLLVVSAVPAMLLAQPLAWALTLVLWYVVSVVEWLARLPWAAAVNALAWAVALVTYGLVMRWLWPKLSKSAV